MSQASKLQRARAMAAAGKTSRVISSATGLSLTRVRRLLRMPKTYELLRMPKTYELTETFKNAICDLNLPNRAFNGLMKSFTREQISATTIDELAQVTEAELLACRDIGIVSARQILDALKSRGAAQ